MENHIYCIMKAGKKKGPNEIGSFQYDYVDICKEFEVFTAVTVKKAVFWNVAPCRSGVNRRFGGTYRLHLQGRGENKKIRTRSVRQRC
jgi:hypothetical protein